MWIQRPHQATFRVTIAHMYWQKAGRDPAIGRQSVRMWLFPWLSYLTIAGMMGVLVAMVRTPSLASQFYFSLLAAMFVGLVYVIRWRLRMCAGPRVTQHVTMT